MSQPSDCTNVLADCRAHYLRLLGAFLRRTGRISELAIDAILGGAGQYFDEMLNSERRTGFLKEAQGLTSSCISLVSEDDLELSIRLDNFSKRLLETAGVGLWKIHLRFATLLRRPDLPRTDNPVGPKSIHRGLEAMFKAAGTRSLDERLDLLDRLESDLHEGLPDLYTELDAFLSTAGVEASQPTIVSAPDKPAAHRALPGETTQAVARSAASSALQQAMAARFPPAADAPVSIGGSLLSRAAIDQILFRLSQLDRGIVGGAPAQSGPALGLGGTAFPIIGEFAAPEGTPALQRAIKAHELGVPTGAPEGIAIDTLAMIFNVLFSHDDLPDALKLAMSSVQIAIIKAAMRDNTLFTDAEHPWRQILERMRTALLGLPLDASTRHPVCTKVVDIATRLRTDHGDEAVARAIRDLDAVIAERKTDITRQAETLLPLLRQIDRRDQARLATTAVLRKATAAGVPDEARFLFDDVWKQVLETNWMVSGPESREWQTVARTAEELAWSFRPKADSAERQALATRLPQVLRNLNSSMEACDIPVDVQAKVLDLCFELQTRAIRPTAPIAQMTAPTPAKPKDVIEAPKREIAIGSIEAGGRRLTLLDYREVVPAPAQSSCQAGEWLTLLCEGQPKTGLICHVSPASGRLLILNPEGDVALAVHPVILEAQLRSGEATVKSRESLFDKAAEAALAEVQLETGGEKQAK